MKPPYLCSLISCHWPTWLLPDVSVSCQKHSWLWNGYKLCVLTLIQNPLTLCTNALPVYTGTTGIQTNHKDLCPANKIFFLLNNTQYKSTTNSIQPALLKMCSPLIYHVRFLSLNCLIKDMIIPNTLLNLSPLLPSCLSKNKRLSLSPSFWTCQWSVKILSAQIKHFLIWSCFIPYKEVRKTTSSKTYIFRR